jgi:hypothetical protein
MEIMFHGANRITSTRLDTPNRRNLFDATRIEVVASAIPSSAADEEAVAQTQSQATFPSSSRLPKITLPIPRLSQAGMLSRSESWGGLFKDEQYRLIWFGYFSQ